MVMTYVECTDQIDIVHDCGTPGSGTHLTLALTMSGNKRTRHQVFVFPGIRKDIFFTKAKDNYYAVHELLLVSRMPEDHILTRAQQVAGIQEDDEERQVYTL